MIKPVHPHFDNTEAKKMDKGAHFYKCDFQVHTPRDPNWKGACPVSQEDREAYAISFIAACRKNSIDAVAITDHHDFGFFPFIKNAAANETRGGKLIPEEDQLVVFPGVELTLGVPCQALLILDADFPENMLPAVLNVLGIEPNEATEKRHAQTEQLGQFRDLLELHKRLEEQPYIKGKFILLPNLSPKGYQTLHRTGFLSHYKSMPCVGGYLDGGIERITGEGDWKILNGEIDAYGNKAVGLFATSDSRQADFATLGDHCTWVKWTSPTAEALRQACLARETRISHSEPEFASLVIESMHVSNSKFMGPIDLRFNSQFNCLIGGRGTGKSTILEYVRWALCDQTPAFEASEELPDFQAKRKSLIENTLRPNTVDVNFIKNSVRHTVRRKSESHEILLKVGDGEFEEVTEADVRENLAVDAYSQKQLSSVGVRTEELLRFIKAPLKKELVQIRIEIDDLKAAIRSSYGLIDRKRQLEAQVAKAKLELGSLTQQVEALRKRLKGLTEAEQQVIQNNEKYSIEERLLSAWERETEALQRAVNDALQQIKTLPSDAGLEADLLNQELIGEYFDKLSSMFNDSRTKLNSITVETDDAGETARQLAVMRQKWQAKFEAHCKSYQEVKNRATTHKKTLDDIAIAEARIKDLQEEISMKESAMTTQGAPENVYLEAREAWKSLFKKRANLLEERCRKLTELSGGALKATLKRGAGTTEAHEQISSILERSGIRQQSQKVDDLCQQISKSKLPVDEWEKLLSEIELLAMSDSTKETSQVVPDCPSLSIAGFTAGDVEKIIGRIDVSRWLDLSLVELEDEPRFQYRQRVGDYIEFRDASAGQQATVLLRVLLNQEGPPLIIDQPEEDLDNEVILNIVQDIWKAKKNRQIIVTSHNANIVVNGDADLVVICAYREGTEQSGGRIKLQGAIDVEKIRKEITTIMEGGLDAFKLRKEKYGF
ncbi:AAA family ATPase [Mariniblastus sp.]|nr:AAA family ATPase [Mariniblastus sp.]